MVTRLVVEEPEHPVTPTLGWERLPACVAGLDGLPDHSRERFARVDVAQYDSLTAIWVNLADKLDMIGKLMEDMRKFYETDGGMNEESLRIPVENLRPGMPVAVCYSTFGWHRAVVKRVSPDKSEWSLCQLYFLFSVYGRTQESVH